MSEDPEVTIDPVEAPPPPLAFEIVMADEMEEGEEAEEIVEGVFLEGGAGMVYGDSNSGKTFFTLDIAAHVASGTPWRDDLEVEAGCVVYVALEGGGALRNRLKALRQAGILKPGAPLFICRDRVSLLEAGHAAMLAQTVRNAALRASVPCKLVVLDTMARAMAGGDENKGEDMTEAIKTIDAVRAATGAYVLIVHHSGKDAARGARGHSSLRAAIDTEIEIFRNEGDDIITAKITKQRDLEFGPPMPFKLKVLEVGKNRKGKIITSCVVSHQDEMMATERKKPGRPKKYNADDLLQYLPAADAADWLRKANEDIGISSSSFYPLKDKLFTEKKYRKKVGSSELIRTEE